MPAPENTLPKGIFLTEYGSYKHSWREGSKQKAKSFPTLKEAVEFKEACERRLKEGKQVMRRKDVPTLEEFAAQWLAGRSDLEESTQLLYARLLTTHVLPTLGHLPLVDLRPRRLAEWQEARLRESAGPAVIGKTQALLGQILQKAVLPYEYLDQNPVTALDRPGYEKRTQRWLTAQEVEALRTWYLERDDLGSATLISVLAYIGIRPQDALARVWGDLGVKLLVDTKISLGELRSGSKTSREHKRKVYVPDPVREDLEEWRLVSRGARLIWPRSDGKPWTKTDWDNWRARHPKHGNRPRCFKAAAEAVGLGSTLTPYHLRHTAATLYAAAGWNHVQVAKQLGHSPEVSARIYQHLLDEQPSNRTIEDYIHEARAGNLRVPGELEARA